MASVPEYFRFLDLLAGLRLMFVNDDGEEASSFTLIITSTPTAILRTSRFIKEEAEDIIDTTIQRFLQPGGYEGPAPRIEAGVTALKHLSASNGVLSRAVASYQALMASGNGSPVVSDHHDNIENDTSTANCNYRIKNGTKQDTIEQLRKWTQYAAMSLYHQKLPAETTNGYAGLPWKHEIPYTEDRRPHTQIALRKCAGDSDESIEAAVYSFALDTQKLMGDCTVAIGLQVLGRGVDNARDGLGGVAHGMIRAFMEILSRQIKHGSHCLITATLKIFDAEEEDVYDRWWMDCDWVYRCSPFPLIALQDHD